MGHSFHFLQRLERADDVHIKRAMELYHRPRLVTSILHRLSLSDEHQRLGISLDPEDEGPFLVLSAEGEFITCLGRGMFTGSLYIVNFERYELLRQRSVEMLSNVEACVDMDDFVRTLTGGGLMLEQEAFCRLASLFPLMKDHFFKAYVTAHGHLAEFLESMRGDKSSVKGRALRRKMRWYWQLHMTLAHFGLLSALKGEEPYTEPLKSVKKSSSDPDDFSMFNIFSPLFYTGELALMIRALWIVGRAGKSQWPVLKKMLRDETLYVYTWRFAFFSSLVLAVRHRSLRKEIEKFVLSKKILSMDQFVLLYSDSDVEDDAMEQWMTNIFLIVKNPDFIFESSSTFAKEQSLFALNAIPAFEGDPILDEISPTESFAVLGGYSKNSLEEGTIWQLIAVFIPWIARIEAHEFYLPKRIACRLQATQKDQIILGTDLFRLHKKHSFEETTKRYKKRAPGPNERCHCGSGNKYKKCCMRKDKAKKNSQSLQKEDVPSSEAR